MGRNTQFGTLLSSLRRSRRPLVSQTKLGDLVNLSRDTIAGYESRGDPPPPETVKRIAEKLGFLPGSSEYEALLAAALADRTAAKTSSTSKAKLAAERLQNQHAPSTKVDNTSSPESTVRRILRSRVHQYWIQGVLSDVQKTATLTKLTLEYVPPTAQDRWEEAPRTLAFAQKRPLERQIIELLDDQSGPLAIVGQPGSGKTTLLLECASQLLERAEADHSQPIPVIFPLASWSERQIPLEEWLVEELWIRYGIPTKQSQTLIDEDRLQLLLDGLDEVRNDMRAACVEAINTFQRAHPVVLLICCRLEEYQQFQLRLRTQGQIIVQPLNRQQIDAYLRKAGKVGAALRTALHLDDELLALASSPLLLGIMLQVWRVSPQDFLQNSEHRENTRQALWQTYLAQMLTRGRTIPGQDPNQLYHWLTWVAQHLRNTAATELRIDQLQFDGLPERYRWQYAVLDRGGVALIIGLLYALGLTAIISGYGLLAGYDSAYYLSMPQDVARFAILGVLVGGLFGGHRRTMKHQGSSLWLTVPQTLLSIIFDGLVLGVIGYAITGLPGSAAVFAIVGAQMGTISGGIGLGPRYIDVLGPREWSWTKALQVLPIAATIGACFGLLSALTTGQINGVLGQILPPVLASVVAGLTIGTLVSLMFGFVEYGLREQAPTPNDGIRRSARNAAMGAVLGALIGATFGLLAAVGPVTWLIIAWSSALIGALGMGGFTCLSHIALRTILWRYDLFPWRYQSFLDNCTRRGVLRKIGGSYEFIHETLLDHLSNSAHSIDGELFDPPMRSRTTRTPISALRQIQISRIVWRSLASVLACFVLIFTQPQAQYVLFGREDPNQFDLTVSNDTARYHLDIHAGDRITVSSTGQLLLGPFTGITTSFGKDRDSLGFPLGNSFKFVRNLPTGALLCGINVDKRSDAGWRLCSGRVTFTAEYSGRLLFLVNSTDTSTHQGYYEVTVHVEPASSQKTTTP